MLLKIELSDFEKYRPELLRYATGLLLSRGSANTKTKEIIHKAKDIVQETYFAFHKHYQDNFVSEFHLKSFLNICLYKKYQESIRLGSKINQYSILKKGDLDILIDTEHPLLEPIFDELETFKSILEDNELEVLNNLLEGFNQVEISNKLNISENGIGFIVKSIRNKYLGTSINKIVKEKNRVKKIVINSEKPVKQIDHNGVTIKTWSSGAIAAYELDLASSAISNCCKGKRLSHGNFKWEFVK